MLTNLPRDWSGKTRTHNLSVIERLGKQGSIFQLFECILNDQSLIEEIAKRSYRHTNHFDKIVLIDSGDRLGYRLTLHLWTPPYSSNEANDEQIHDHRFSFWSHILTGRMISQNFVRDATGTFFAEYQYIPEKLGTSTVGNFYIDVGKSPLLESEKLEYRAGEFYSFPYNQIHRVVLPLTEMTCTIVLRGPRQKNYASVFSNSKMYDPSRNIMFSSKKLKDKLSAIMNTMEKNTLINS